MFLCIYGNNSNWSVHPIAGHNAPFGLSSRRRRLSLCLYDEGRDVYATTEVITWLCIGGNSQMYDSAAMEEALRRCTSKGYTTIKSFQIFSGLKPKSAKAYLDSLCEGPNPRMWRYREGRTWHYAYLKNNPPE